MKRKVVTWAGAAILAAALACAAPVLADPHNQHGGGGHGQGRDGGGQRGGPQGGPYGGQRSAPPGAYAPRGYAPRGYLSGPPQGGPPMGQPWNDQRHDGYWVGNRWHYGPPPETAYGAQDVRPGYAPWRRGAILPPYYRGGVIMDYARFHLRRPPPGYDWVQVGDSFLLVAGSTGVIYDVAEGF